MDVKEHVYADDPARGPRDVRTNLDGVEYFFVGNGLMQAAVQVCDSGAGTPAGLLILRPDRLGPKRDVLTMDPEEGLSPTMIRLHREGGVAQALAEQVRGCWGETGGIPTVCVSWQAEGFEVEERFWCADRSTAALRREVRVKSAGGAGDVTFRTGVQDQAVERKMTLAVGEKRVITLVYRVREAGGEFVVDVECLEESSLPNAGADTRTGRCGTCATGQGGKAEESAEQYWRNLSQCQFSSELPNHVFEAARRHLPATITSAGRMDGSIWQYNLEWVRDQAAAFTAFVMLGDFKLARTMLDRLLNDFVTDDGDTVDSGRRRGVQDVELDQNGELLLAVKNYIEWTGDTSILQKHRKRIHALAEYPLREVFRHEPSGLLHNQREYWERHALYGIEDGMEMVHQLFVSIGLTTAAELARYAGWPAAEAERWDREAGRIKQAMLFDERYGSVHEGRFIKRRKVDGRVQWELNALPDANLPPGVPLSGPGPHYLNPDTESALPIALEFIDPRGALARNTLAAVEELWNQNWDFGGYGRYHVSSEPDAPGPWPFASMFVARAYWEAGEDEKAWRILRWLGETASPRAGSWFEFYGPRPTPPCPQVGIIPWTWAEIVIFFIHHVFGVRPGLDELYLRPRLPRGIDWAETKVTVGSHRVYLKMRRAKQGEGNAIVVDGLKQAYSPEGLRLPRPQADMHVELVQE